MQDDFDWKRVQDDFPVNSQLIWLNNCGTTPISRPVLRAVTEWLEAYSQRGSLAESHDYASIRASIYRRLQKLFNAQPGEFAIIHNTAEGMNFLSHGMDLKAGSEILLLENEYPSNVYPWQHWAGRGVALKTVPTRETPAAFLDAFVSTISPQTRLASLSAVHWCTGMPLPIREVAEICADRGIELVLDGSQGAGLVEMDMRWGIHFMAFSAWKWLLGPVGVGLLYISQGKLASVRPIFKGTESVIGDREYLPYKDAWKPTTERFAYSTGNFNDWVYLDASLGYLEEIGFARVQSRIRYLASYLAAGLRALGFTIASDAYGESCGIVAADRPGLDSGRAVQALKAKGIVAVARMGRIRFAPHVYNSIGQLDQVLSALRELI